MRSALAGGGQSCSVIRLENIQVVNNVETTLEREQLLQKFTVSENSLCTLFANDARRQL